jgi:5-formyltetrahydrofolate cyclo-ligase
MRKLNQAKQEAANAAKRKPNALAPQKKDWRAKHQEFQNAIKAGRQVSDAIKNGVDLRTLPVQRTAEEHDDRVQCPHCQRKFAELVADRHIPHCKNTVNKPAPPPGQRSSGGATMTRGPVQKPALGGTRRR